MHSSAILKLFFFNLRNIYIRFRVGAVFFHISTREELYSECYDFRDLGETSSCDDVYGFGVIPDLLAVELNKQVLWNDMKNQLAI